MLFTKSARDLGKNEVEHRVLCDWLRNIHQQNIQLARKVTLLQNKIDSLLEENNPRPEEYDDSSESRSVS